MRSSSASARFIATPTSMRRPCSRPPCSCARGPKSSLPARFPAWRATWKPSPPASRRACTPWNSHPAAVPNHSRGRPRWARSAITYPAPSPSTINRRISLSTCCRSSMKRPVTSCGTTNTPATRKSAGGPPKPWTSICTRMSELELEIGRYLEELARAQASPHTLEAYGGDLRQFLEYFTPPESQPPPLAQFGVLEIREWLADLYSRQLSAVSIRRKLAAVRSLFRFLSREGLIRMNPARLVRTPKAPQSLPDVMTAEQVNGLIDAVAADKFERAHPARDRAIFEFLYGCGIRVSELVGLNLEDIDRAERWIRVRGKGKKERQVPFTSQAATALDRYLPERGGGAPGARHLPEPPRRAAPRARGGRHRQAIRHTGERRFLHSPAQFPPRLRHASAGRRRRPARHTGVAGSCAPFDHPEIHSGVSHRSDGGL